MSDDYLTPPDVARELGVTPRTVQRWIADGRLAALRVGGRLRVSRSSLPAVRQPPRTTTESAGGGPIRTLLIANRGEIAERIASTARKVGITPVGVHGAGERPADGVTASAQIESYLDADSLLAAAQQLGADAVHPGYGFLAERASFAEAVVAAGLTWVGPPASAIRAMGDKAAARRRVAEHGVPVVPGYDGAAQDDEALAAAARRIGVPLLVKPSAGGGGKGMRIVRDLAALAGELEASRREARGAFGDDRLVLERYVEGPRHVEIQVLFDAHGAAVHLGERDCSTQRRQQKVVEESPAPSVSPELRARMGRAALRAAASVGYVNAGTVEFLLADDGEFYFLEMNTRLQVEHAVTEAVTGRDLVADQLRIAAGDELGLSQDEVHMRGHAIEARLYAEDPEHGFLPAAGRVAGLDWPDGIRIDTATRVGDEITDRYDPMIAKLIAHGESRDQALGRLSAALADTGVLGVRTNLRLLRWLLAQPVMRRGEMRTDSLAGLELPGPAPVDDDAWQAAATALAPRAGWRLNAPSRVVLRHDDEVRSVAVPERTPEQRFAVDPSTGEAFVDVQGQSVEFEVAPPPSVEEAVRHASTHDGGHASLSAPMPGRVIAINVGQGGAVAAQQPVVVIEAMKMEHGVVSPLAGRVTRLLVEVGAQVERGALLAEVEASSETTAEMK